MRGEVIGINSQIFTTSGSYAGISFAIPIDEATRVADQLRNNGRVIRGRIGVSIDQVTKDVADAIGLGKPMGALVRSVEAGGPAEKAGVEPGDIITRFEGKPIEKSSDLPRTVTNIKPGTRAGMQVFRRGAYKDLQVTVVEFEPERARRTSEREESKPQAAVGSLGLSVVDLTEAQKRELKVKGGVRVEMAEGLAARAGIREGDVILSIENTEVTSAKQFEQVASKLDKSKPATLLVRRGDVVNFVIVRPGR
jgi:serine protease Do